jgi:hypothetical protein
MIYKTYQNKNLIVQLHIPIGSTLNMNHTPCEVMHSDNK